jgi:hypothetical protein
MTTDVNHAENEIENAFMERPHLVLLGAGASLAAFPNGDRNGRKLPLMNNLVQVVGLEGVLSEAKVDYEGRNFEDVYSDLHGRVESKSVVEEIENRIRRYFGSLELPDEPTLYDHLVLSLRSKDVVATFNWDPFLFQACARNRQKTKLPHVFFLHGNVAIGYCLNDRLKGPVGARCKRCGSVFSSSKLLYPVANKDYASASYIQGEWNILRQALRNAYVLTIFGYSAPKTDLEAIRLLKEGWGNPDRRELEQTEIIDIKEDQELVQTWREFICAEHYETTTSFYESWIARHPRRTCEAVWNQFMELGFVQNNPIPYHLGFEDLWKWHRSLMEAETEGD